MVWTRLDDQFWCNPKLMGASDRAYRLYVNALNWSVANFTDGRIPEYGLGMLLPGSTTAPTKRAAAELCNRGLWHEISLGFEINDFADYQFTKAEWEERSGKAKAKSVKGVHARWHKEKPDPKCAACRGHSKNASRDARRHSGGDASSDAPAQPSPPQPNSSSSEDSEFRTFNLKRAEWEVEKRQKAGLEVKSPGGLARTIAADSDHLAESVRVWEHRECLVCGGSGSKRVYSEGSGGVLVDCDGSE